MNEFFNGDQSEYGINQVHKRARQYAQAGFSVIPVRLDKKPFIPWQRYQMEKADEGQIEEWWSRWPEANCAIVTGPISGLDVLDIDTKVGEETVANLLGDDVKKLNAPMSRTPRGGKHLFFKRTGAGNAAGFIDGVDYRGEGGYIIVPPSRGPNGRGYEWAEGASLFDLEPPELPAPLRSLLINSFNRRGRGGRGANEDTQRGNYQRLLKATRGYKKIPEGQRDDVLFYLANALINHNLSIEEIEHLLNLMALHCCEPPFPQKEIHAKIKSVLQRTRKQKRNIAQEAREWAEATGGYWDTTRGYAELLLTTRDDRRAAAAEWQRMCKDGILERYGDKRGCYRPVERDYEILDLENLEDADPIAVKLPFQMENLVELMPKDLIVFAGTPNSGKTALMFEAVRLNMDRHKCFYFSTELGRHAAKKRLKKHDECEVWNFKFTDDFPNYLDVIRPDDINFIDYVEVPEGEFYKIPSILSGIQKRLKNGVAFVALQKNPGVRHALGGAQTKAKPALFCTLEEEHPGAKIMIEKGKNWIDTNPNGLVHKFKIVGGINIISEGDWERDI